MDVDRSVMEENLVAYKVMHQKLVERYLGQYVAICDGQLIDHDPDPVVLLQRVRDRHPDQIILRRRVERLLERGLCIRHPWIETLA